MTTFKHSSVIGDFFDVLHQAKTLPPPPPDTCSFASGCTKKREAAFILCRGDFQLAQAAQFAQTLDASLTGNVKVIVLDFSQARSFSANASAILTNFLAGVLGRQKKCIIFRPSEAVRSMLAALDLGYLITIQETEEELLLDLPDEPLT